jgi:hypothetical protein
LPSSSGAKGGDDRDPAGVDEVHEHGGVHLGDVADAAEIDLLAVDPGVLLHGGEQAGVLPGGADGERAVLVDEVDQFAADLAEQHHPDVLHGLRGGVAQAADELPLEPDLVEHLGDLGTAAVDDDGVSTDGAQEGHVGGEGRLEILVDHRVAAVLHDDDLAAVVQQPGQRLGQHIGPDRRRQVGGAPVDDLLGGL